MRRAKQELSDAGRDRTITVKRTTRVQDSGSSRIDLQGWGGHECKSMPPAAPTPPPADQTATASDSAMESAPAPMESDEEQDDESVPEVPGTTI